MAILPLMSEYDPGGDPPGSVDPLGTVAGAEQLAEVLLPGLTARMWRVRLITLAALTARIAERVAGEREDQYLEARLAFERLAVAALARKQPKDATRRLPGVELARRSKTEALTRRDFLKGPAVNGPFGVIARLARAIGILNGDQRLLKPGEDLLHRWGREQGCDVDDGGQTLNRYVKETEKILTGEWPTPGWNGWDLLVKSLSLDGAGDGEREWIARLMQTDAMRSRVLTHIKSPGFATVMQSGPEVVQNATLRRFAELPDCEEIDASLRASARLVLAYEQLSRSLDQVFRVLVWSLTRRNSQARLDEMLAVPGVRDRVAKLADDMKGQTSCFRDMISAFQEDTYLCRHALVDFARMESLASVGDDTGGGVENCIAAVMQRHRSVQRQKRKGDWISEDHGQWMLHTGYGAAGEKPDPSPVHPYRIRNARTMLTDLKLMAPVVDDAE